MTTPSILSANFLTFTRATSRARVFIESLTIGAGDSPLVQGRRHPNEGAADATGSYTRLVEPPVLELQCERCHGHRSPSYHIKHYKDPVAFPRVGVCSRRRTNCAVAKSASSRASYGGLPIAYELPANEAKNQVSVSGPTSSMF
jgi:hypothetical protein